ncbi:MAG: 16S rRNA (uracil(1498)-N(3))-methyltransferase [Lentisphaeria bacterium]|nr:16S rRNA (uracil(1498)-N(3))-methyltransferase [Lentisphaeria bacterium]
MNLLLLQESDRTAPDVFRVTGRRAEHIRKVLRAEAGDRLRAGLLGGGIGSAEVIRLGRAEVEVRCPSFDLPPPRKNRLVPIISLPRPQSFKKTLHFIASSGIAKAYFVGSARVEKSYWKSGAMEPDAIREEILLGLEQGVDTIPPELKFHTSLREFFAAEKDFLERCGHRLIAHPEPDAPPCPHALELQRDLALAIGPEGGYTPEEVAAFRSHGFECVTLGAFILRVEFALSVLYGKLTP